MAKQGKEKTDITGLLKKKGLEPLLSKERLRLKPLRQRVVAIHGHAAIASMMGKRIGRWECLRSRRDPLQTHYRYTVQISVCSTANSQKPVELSRQLVHSCVAVR